MMLLYVIYIRAYRACIVIVLKMELTNEKVICRFSGICNSKNNICVIFGDRMAIFLRFMTWRVGAEAPFPGWDMGVLRMAPLRNRKRLEFRSEYPANDSSKATLSDQCIWRALKSSLRS